MKNKKLLLILVSVLVAASAFAYGCGGDTGGATISTREPGDIYLPGNNTASAQVYSQAQDTFNNGSYSNAQSDFQKAYEIASTSRDKNRAISGVAWSIMKNAAAEGKSSIDNDLVLLTVGKIPKADLDNVTNQELNDARVAMAMAYLAKSQTASDFQNAISAIEKIEATASGTTYTTNKFFTYTSTLNHGITNAEVHAVLAYLYFLNGNKTAAQEQINYAFQLDPQNDKVIKIKSTLTVLGVYR